MKEKYFVDLDGTLWETNARAWIVDKNNPTNAILKIDSHTFNLLIKGHYMKDNNKISYDGINAWLSNELLTKIKQKKPIELNRIGLSIREYSSTPFIVNQKNSLTFHINRFNILKDKHITLLTARGNKDAHEPLLKQLQSKLLDINVNIEDSIFIYDLNEYKYNNTGDTSLRKLIKLIQSLIGYEIHDNKFVPIQCEEFDIVHFYDDEDKNIELCNDINSLILHYYNNSDSIMKKRLENKKLIDKKLITYLVTTNKIKPFIENIINLNNI